MVCSSDNSSPNVKFILLLTLFILNMSAEESRHQLCMLSRLKNVLRKPHKALKGFYSRFTELHAKVRTCSSILPSVTDKMKHKVEKALA
jgi:hypothetical protein